MQTLNADGPDERRSLPAMAADIIRPTEAVDLHY
jgi:hypothetical protein